MEQVDRIWHGASSVHDQISGFPIQTTAEGLPSAKHVLLDDKGHSVTHVLTSKALGVQTAYNWSAKSDEKEKRKVKQWHCNSGEALTKSLQNWASSATAPHYTHTHTFQCSSYKSQPEPGWEIMMIISLSHRNTGPSLGSDDLIISH